MTFNNNIWKYSLISSIFLLTFMYMSTLSIIDKIFCLFGGFYGRAFLHALDATATMERCSHRLHRRGFGKGEAAVWSHFIGQAVFPSRFTAFKRRQRTASAICTAEIRRFRSWRSDCFSSWLNQWGWKGISKFLFKGKVPLSLWRERRAFPTIFLMGKNTLTPFV